MFYFIVIIVVSYTGELETAVRYTLNHIKGYLQAMKKATEKSSAEIYRCDQQKHIIGKF